MKIKFLEQFGAIMPWEQANARWDECRVPGENFPHTGRMFSGEFWQSGYFLPEQDPLSDHLPWDNIAKDFALTQALAKELSAYSFTSETDCDYFPCFFYFPDTGDFKADFRRALGWLVEDQYLRDEFWGDWRVNEVKGDDTALFWYKEDAPYMDEYYQPDHLRTLKEITLWMKQELTAVRRVSLPDAYITTPTFWLGRTAHGSWVGLWSFGVYT